jgi:predicted Zn-dependent peptidase
LTQSSGKYQIGEDVAGVWEAPELFKKLDVASIKTAATTYLNTKNYVKVTLLPEKK